MEKRFLTTKIKAIVIILFVVVLSNKSYSQASYKGGEGGGYTSTDITISTSVENGEILQTKLFEFNIFPNPLHRGQLLKAKVQGVEPNEKLYIIVSDMIGSRVHFEEIDAAEEVTINLPIEKLKKGIYLVTFQFKHHKFTRRFTFVE